MSKSLKRIPVAAWLGIVLLVFSFACVIWVNGMGVHAAEDNNSPAPKSDGVKVTECYGYVDIEPSVSKLYALQPNRVVKIIALEDGSVKKDAPLIQLDDTLAKNKLADAKRALAKAENDLEDAKLLPNDHAEQIAGQEAAVAAKKQEVEAAKQTRDQAKANAKGELGVTQKDVAAAEAIVHAREEVVKGEEAKLRILKNAEPRIQRVIDNAKIQVEEKKALVDAAEYALAQCTIKAPENGTVLRILVAEGDVLGTSPREPAVMFCPDNKPRILRGEVEQEFAQYLKKEQRVLARDDSPGSPDLNGRVTRVSDWYSHRRSLVQEPLFNDVRTVECIITLDPTDPPLHLRIGQRFRVSLLGVPK